MNIPKIETYRGVGIHDFQDRERIEEVVKPEIDRVFATSDPQALFEIAGDVAQPPEARQFSRDKYVAAHQIRASAHIERLGRLELLDAMVAGLDSLGWASPWVYGSLLDRALGPGERGGAAPRPAHQRVRLERAQAAARVAEQQRRSPA